MSEDEENGDAFKIQAQAHSLELTVAGGDAEWVEDTFDDKLLDMVKVLEEEGNFHIEGGAGWLMAHAHGQSPEEAYEQWESMWDRMLEDVEELSEQEREQAGLSRQ